MKWLTVAFILLISTQAQAFQDRCYAITNEAQARTTVSAAGLESMLSEDGWVRGNHDVAIDYWERPILDFGPPVVFAATPYIRVRFVSPRAIAGMGRILNPSGGIQRKTCPPTRIWFGD